MPVYEKMVKLLRYCANADCTECAVAGCPGPQKFLQEAADAIDKLIEERKTGEWCADYDGYSDGEPVYDMWWCSACGEYFDEWDDRPTWKYCPNCGAKMSRGDEDV